MKKGYLFIAIGLIIILFCSRNLFKMLYVFDGGMTVLEYEVISDIDNNILSKDISENIGISLDGISVVQDNDRLRVELDYINQEELNNLEQSIETKYNGEIQVVSSNLIGSMKPNSIFYIIMAALSIFLITGLAMIIKGVLMLKEEAIVKREQLLQ
jgi:hypothetical protein